jgi:hypothetical protein
MEVDQRQAGRPTDRTRILLILGGAALVSLGVFVGLLAATAHAMTWTVNGGVDRYERLSPGARLFTTIVVPQIGALIAIFSGIAAAKKRKQQKASRRFPTAL